MKKIVTLVLVLGIAGAGYAEWTEPVCHTELNIDELVAAQPSLSADERVICFVAGYLMEAHREDADSPFEEARVVTELGYDGGRRIVSPWISADGLRLYYAEILKLAGSELWQRVIKMAEREHISEQWTEVEIFLELHVNGIIDTAPALTDDELTILFLSSGGGDWKAYTATRESVDSSFSVPVEVVELTGVGAFKTHLSDDGLRAYFGANRPDNGTRNIYMMTRPSLAEPFGDIEHLDGVTDPDTEGNAPWPSSDEKTIYFSGEREEQNGIWVTQWEIKVGVDINPRSCPNRVNVKSKSVLAVAVLGTEEFDVTTIDPVSISLNGVPAIRSSYKDVSGPVAGLDECECAIAGPDGFYDLALKFNTQQIVESLGVVNTGDVLTLPLTGVLNDGTFIKGTDCIVIAGGHKPN